MSLEMSLNTMKQKLQQKNLIAVTGNVYDLFPEKGRKHINIIDIISKELKEEIGITNVNIFNPAKGLYEYGEEITGQDVDEENLFGDDEMGNEGISLSQALKKAIESLENWDIKNGNTPAYIFDFTDMLLDRMDTKDEVFNSITKLLSLIMNPIKANSVHYVTQTQPKIIFIQRNSNSINQFIKGSNSEFANVEILLPSVEERRTFFRAFSNKFNISNSKKVRDVEAKEHSEAVALTDKMNFKEMLQLARIGAGIDEKLTFKELYTWAQSSKRESEWTQLSPSKVKKMDKNFKKSLFGQDYAIESVKNTIIRSFMGMTGAFHSSLSSKPKGVLFFSGPTGTGKTQLAKLLALEIFGDESKMIRFDMSEYNHEESDAKLIGSAPGYVGFGSGGQLTNAVKKNPFSIILFDEIEKAHPRILDKFLQILEDGRLTSGQGELVDFSETFIIFTSNIGQDKTDEKNDEIKNRNIFKKEVMKFFKSEKVQRPELLNRIGEDNIVPFNYITDVKIIQQLVKSKVEKYDDKLKKEHNVNVRMDDDALMSLTDLIADQSDPKMGGRGIMTTLEKVYGDSITRFLFDNYEKVKDDNEIKHIKVKVHGSKFSIDFI